MALQARVIGPASELGTFENLDFYGNALTREFQDVDFTDEAYEKAKGNPFIEVKGTQAKEDEEDHQAAQEREKMIARLSELGEKVDGRASVSTLKSKLDAAEKAEAKRLEEVEKHRQAVAEADAEQ